MRQVREGLALERADLSAEGPHEPPVQLSDALGRHQRSLVQRGEQRQGGDLEVRTEGGQDLVGHELVGVGVARVARRLGTEPLGCPREVDGQAAECIQRSGAATGGG